MARKLKINEQILTLFDENKKFIALGSESIEDDNLIKKLISEKISKKTKYHTKDLWATLGFSNDSPINWTGELEFSEDGNENIEDASVLE